MAEQRLDENGCRITTCIDSSGRVYDYVLVKDRVAKFWEMFPVAEGWSVVRTVTAYPFSEAKIALFRLCLEKGVSPADVGLSFPESQVSVLAQLVDKASVVRANATSFGPVVTLKDVETMETAAFGRLMATVGLPGAPGELDDGAVVYSPKESIPTAQSVNRPRQAPPPAAASVAASDTPREFTLEVLPVRDDEVSPRPMVRDDAPSLSPPPAPDAATPAASAAPDPSARVPLAIVTQIRTAASRLGVEPPHYSGVEEAKTVLSELRARVAQ